MKSNIIPRNSKKTNLVYAGNKPIICLKLYQVSKLEKVKLDTQTNKNQLTNNAKKATKPSNEFHTNVKISMI